MVINAMLISLEILENMDAGDFAYAPVKAPDSEAAMRLDPLIEAQAYPH